MRFIAVPKVSLQKQASAWQIFLIVGFASTLVLYAGGLTLSKSLFITAFTSFAIAAFCNTTVLLTNQSRSSPLTIGMAFIAVYGWLILLVVFGLQGLPKYFYLLLPALFFTLRRYPRQKILKVRASLPGSSGIRVGTLIAITTLTPILLLLNFRQAPLPIDDGILRLHRDLYFQEVLGNGLSRFGFGESGIVSNIGLRYHDLTYAFTGVSSDLFHLSPLEGLVRVGPAFFLFGIGFLLAGTLGHFRHSTLAFCLTFSICLIATSLDPFSGSAVILNSASFTSAGLLVLALFQGFSMDLDGSRNWRLLALFAISFLLAGSKISTAIAFLGAITLFTIASIFFYRTRFRDSLLATLVVACGSFLAYALLMAQQVSSGTLVLRFSSNFVNSISELGITSSIYGLIVAVAVPIILWLPRASGIWILGFSDVREKRADFFFGVSMIVSPCICFCTFTSRYSNEYWFLGALIIPIGLLSSIGIYGFLAHGQLRSVPTQLAVWILCALGLAILFWSQSRTSEATLRPYLILFLLIGIPLVCAYFSLKLLNTSKGIRVSQIAAGAGVILVMTSVIFGAIRLVEAGTSQILISQTDAAGNPDDRPTSSSQVSSFLQAADWLKSHALPEDVLLVPGNSSALVSALVGIRSYVSSDFEARSLTSKFDQDEIDSRIALSSEVAIELTPSLARRLCREGVDWIWIPNARGLGRHSFANVTIEYSNREVSIVKTLCGP